MTWSDSGTRERPYRIDIGDKRIVKLTVVDSGGDNRRYELSVFSNGELTAEAGYYTEGDALSYRRDTAVEIAGAIEIAKDVKGIPREVATGLGTILSKIRDEAGV